jgi:hypothetical protein
MTIVAPTPTAFSGEVFPVAARSNSATTLELHLPPSTETAWLQRVRRMRGEVIYAGGRRPSFLRPDGRFDDPDTGDFHSFHIVARCGGSVVGGVRYAALNGGFQSMVASVIGATRLESQIRDMGVDPGRVGEASRWTVPPEYRGVLGRRLAAASWALARWLGSEVSFVVAGTRERQDIALIRMGARPVAGVPLIPCEEFDDELRLIYFQVAEVPASMRPHLDAAAAELDLN